MAKFAGNARLTDIWEFSSTQGNAQLSPLRTRWSAVRIRPGAQINLGQINHLAIPPLANLASKPGARGTIAGL